jgi:hypothetical protein
MRGYDARFEQISKDGTAVTIVDKTGQVEYSYITSQKTAVKVNLQAQTSVPVMTAFTTTSVWEWGRIIIKNPDATAFACAQIDGLHTFPVQIPYQGEALKAWMASDYGLPLRIEYQGNVIEFKNFVFGIQPDSQFKLPSNVVVQK